MGFLASGHSRGSHKSSSSWWTNSLPQNLMVHLNESSDLNAFKHSSLALVPSASNLAPSVHVGKMVPFVVNNQTTYIAIDKHFDISDHVGIMLVLRTSLLFLQLNLLPTRKWLFLKIILIVRILPLFLQLLIVRVTFFILIKLLFLKMLFSLTVFLYLHLHLLFP